MPDVTRSDSQRSDTSLRPRVSFNRDVHVKRIVPRESGRIVGALSGDGAGHLVASPVRKERLVKSKQQLAEEAARVLHEVDKIDCISQDKGVHPAKFYTLPARKKNKAGAEYSQASLDRKSRRRNSEEIPSNIPPKKPPRTFASYSKPENKQRSSIFNIFKKSDKTEKETLPKKSNLKRAVSDASNLKSKSYSSTNALHYKNRAGSDTEENFSNLRINKKLSPIIEVTPREDYFTPRNDNDKENIHVDENIKNVENQKSESVTEKLKEYIDEVDTALYKETGIRVSPSKKEQTIPEVVIIDVDKAEKIQGKKSKLGTNIISKKIKSIANKNKTNKAKTKVKSDSPKKVLNNKQISEKVEKKKHIENKIVESNKPAPKIQEAIENLEHSTKQDPTMIHSSQKPAEKLPLTRGRTVDNIVKRLSNDKCSPPPKTNIMITPNVTVQHNNNQPFSYTRGLSPEKSFLSGEESRSPPNPSSPVIYAQVVCGNGGPNNKQTVHTTYTNGKKHLPHSDSDEGLGYEENSGYGKKYESSQHTTQFGDAHTNGFNKTRDDEFYDNDRFDEEFPITPKFKNVGYMNGYNGYEKKFNEFSKTEHSLFVDSSSRGRGDGMDSKRRESLTEPFENGFSSKKLNGNSTNINGRSDLSARRDLLESRINRRFNDKTLRQSPEYSPKTPPSTNLYISESSSKYYRSGSTSPVGYRDKYVSETKTDKNGDAYTTESRTRKYFGETNNRIEYENNHYKDEYNYNGYDNEPKSFDSQVSDYRSSPENRHFETSHKQSNYNRYTSKLEKQKILKDRDFYKSNPEINQRSYDDRDRYKESYHDSLRREKHENNLNSSSKFRTGRYFEHTEERKDKFVDSGIENDFRRDSGENFKVLNRQKREFSNESEDEGFASSLLIASERQHTEDNFSNRKQRKDYEYDRNYTRDSPDYPSEREFKSRESKHEYVHRERSIDDGSHYDPRIDKNLEKEKGTLKRFSDKKPPKPEKKSGLEKMKQLFTRDSKKNKKEKQGMVREEILRARYTEYKGSRENLNTKEKRKQVSELNSSYDISNRRRLSTPSPSPTRDIPQRNGKPENTHSWFKSLDRLSRKKSKKGEKESNLTSTEEEVSTKPTPTKNLRFFGDTDIESNDSVRQKSSLKTRTGLSNINRERIRSQSTRDLHNISEEMRSPDLNVRKNSHKSMLNISESDRDIKGSRSSLKPPMSPNHRSARDISRASNDRNRRRKNEVSSVESSTEGDSSQQSQRSVVYLHAATVGDIPGPGYLRNGRRAASREELISNSSSRIQPQVKTLSRSFSVLAPWRPKHYREGMDIDYTQYPKPMKNGKYEQKVMKNGSSRKENSSTLKKKAQETRRSNQNMSTLTRKSRSKENVSSQTLKRSKEEMTKGSSSTLYKKKERQPKENTRYSRERDEKKMSSKSMSVESLGSNGRLGRKSREDNREISRSISMPRDPEKSAGWFKMSKKNKKSVSSQRL